MGLTDYSRMDKEFFESGVRAERERIIKLLDNLMDFETDTQRRIDHKLALQVLKDALIKGEK